MDYVFFDQENLIVIEESNEYEDLINNKANEVCFLVELNKVSTGDRGNFYIDYNIRLESR